MISCGKFVPKVIAHHFPKSSVKTVMMYRENEWNVKYKGKRGRRQFDNAEWEKFVEDNGLINGDDCVFEILESSKQIVKLKVRVCRYWWGEIEAVGDTYENAIIVD